MLLQLLLGPTLTNYKGSRSCPSQYDFATMMREHHKGAIDMARVELEHGTDPELKSLAQKIIEDQSREIKQLDEWLDKHPMGPGRK